MVTPDEEIADEVGAARQEQLSVGLTRYFKRHRIKSTGELLHDHVAANAAGAARKSWILRWAVELVAGGNGVVSRRSLVVGR